MIHSHDVLRRRLLTGVMEERKPDLDQIRETNWNDNFVAMMKNRMFMGAMRYDVHNLQEVRSDPTVPYGMVDFLRRKLDAWDRTGNAEMLIDVAVLAKLAFYLEYHPDKHFTPLDDKFH